MRAGSMCTLITQTAPAAVGPAEAESNLVQCQHHDVAAARCTPQFTQLGGHIGVAVAALAHPA